MNWPTHTDYQDAMQNPGVCFAEPELKTGEAACDMLGLPRVMSGNFASVYELQTGATRSAIRCFVRQVPGQQGRYARLSQHLNSLTLDCLVKFDYMLKGILVKGEWYPIVKMHWVEGSPLNTWVEDHLNNPAALTKLAADWREMMGQLRQHKLAHGDLQHGNVMVTTDDKLRLVDYDGMYAPVFGRGRAPELGHINFQHPRRTADFYEENLDNFSALVIYTSLLALAAAPELWQKFYTVDNLVLASADFKSPLQSPAFAQLKLNKDVRVQQLATLLEKCCCSSVENVPDFSDVMTALDNGTLDKIQLKSASTISNETVLLKRPVEPLRQSSTVIADAAKSGTRSAYDNVPTVASQKHSTKPTSTSGTKTTPTYQPQAEKSGLPGWVLWGAGAAAVLVIGAFVVFSKKSDPTAAPQANAEPTIQNTTPTAPVASTSSKPQATAPASAAATDNFKVSLLGTLKGHAGTVDFLTFSPDGKTLASSGSDKSIHLWNPQSGQAKLILKGNSDVPGSLMFLADNKTVSCIGLDNILRLWDAGSSEPKQAINTYQKNRISIALSPDGKLFAAGGEDPKLVQLLDSKSGSVKESFPKHSSWVRAVSFSRDGQLLASTCQDDSLTIWEVSSGKNLHSFEMGSSADVLAFSPDHKSIAFASGRNIKIMDIKSGQLQESLSGHDGDVKSLAFSPNGKWLASGSSDKTAKIWNLASGSAKQSLPGHTDSINSIAFSADGKILATGSADHTVKLWELKQ